MIITFLCNADLTKRGWTNGLIATFLPVPDQTKTNPHYKNAAPMKLYLKERVEEIEASESFKEAQNKTGKRVRAASKAVNTKKEKTLQLAKGFNTDVAAFSKEELIGLACQHYNHRSLERKKDWYATPHSDEVFLNRICVNYLRHVQSEYEYSLNQLYGKTGKQKAYNLAKNNTLESIATLYPWLADDCKSAKKP